MNDFDNDFDLIEQLKKGEESALKKLFERYADFIYRIAIAILKNVPESEDVVVEVMMKIWNARTKLDAAGNLSTYIQLVAKRLALNKFRDIQKEKTCQVGADGSDILDDSETDGLTRSKELLTLQAKIFRSLPPQQQLIYKLSREEGMSHKEIALTLDISTNTVKNHIVQALKTFRFYFQKFGYYLFFIFLIFH